MRKVFALIITLYAISFAFGAMAAVRWPSIMMAATSTFIQNRPATGLEGIDWRELGVIYGAPYFLAALCFYAAAVMVSSKRKGGLTWFTLGCASGFPAAFMVDFESGWWLDPSVGEGAVAGAGLAAILIGVAVWELRPRAEKTPAEATAPENLVTLASGEVFQLVPAHQNLPAPKPTKRFHPTGPPSAAIARQRAHFAREGAKMMARRRP